MSFSQIDFDQNPGKYRLFKTAVLSRKLCDGQSCEGFQTPQVGAILRIEFHDIRLNGVTNTMMPVYAVPGLSHPVWANCFEGFAL